MPLIESADPRQVVTPLQPLFPEAVNAAYNFAVNGEEVLEQLNQHGLRFRLDEGIGGFEMAAVGSTFAPRISIGLGALEQAWAAAFAYVIIYEYAAEQHNRRLVNQPAEPPPEPHWTTAVALEKWAYSEKHLEERQPWPDGLPSPAQPFVDDNRMAQVGTAFLAMVAFMVLHEIGHFACGHCYPGCSSAVTKEEHHREEHEADEWAQRRLITNLQTGKQQVCLGAIPFAMGVIAGLNHVETDLHPALVDRLQRFVANFVVPLRATNPVQFGTALLSATVPLQVLLIRKGVAPADIPSFPDLDQYLAWWQERMNQ